MTSRLASVATTSQYALKFANFTIPPDAIGNGREVLTRGLVREENHHRGWGRVGRTVPLMLLIIIALSFALSLLSFSLMIMMMMNIVPRRRMVIDSNVAHRRKHTRKGLAYAIKVRGASIAVVNKRWRAFPLPQYVVAVIHSPVVDCNVACWGSRRYDFYSLQSPSLSHLVVQRSTFHHSSPTNRFPYFDPSPSCIVVAVYTAHLSP